MRPSRNPWDILGLTHGATPEEIKSAYKKQALLHHPDKNGDSEYFKLISDAYLQLKNKTHIPILSKPDIIYVNVKLSIEQQIKGVIGLIDTDKGMLDVKIPPGSLKDDRYKIRSKGKEYIINIQELSHKDFTRQGNNVIMNLNLDIVTAMIGGQYNFIGPDGNNIELEIKSGTQHNDLIVLDKQGLFNKKTNRRGNLHIFVNVEIPKLDSQEDLEYIIKRLKKINK